MFQILSPQKIKHSSGYVLQGGDRFHLEFIEGGKKLVIPVEDRVEDDYEIYWEEITAWAPPHQNDVITSETIAEIREKVLAALEFSKI